MAPAPRPCANSKLSLSMQAHRPVILFSFRKLGRGADLQNRLSKFAPRALRPLGLSARATGLPIKPPAPKLNIQATAFAPRSTAGTRAVRARRSAVAVAPVNAPDNAPWARRLF